jgi:protein-L-isoaspartate(D-aspartate) O-methyltransferase
VEPSRLEKRFRDRRREMIKQQLVRRGISSERVLSAIRNIPRELFVSEDLRDRAYLDQPLPIGFNQTISQPYIVAYMTEQLQVEDSDRVLEVGTGSGYQTAVLAQLARSVHSVEVNLSLLDSAVKRLLSLGCENVKLKHGDGALGWPEEAPFDKVIITAAASEIPSAITSQIREGGKLIAPQGAQGDQTLILARMEKGVLLTKPMLSVRFVPLKVA